MTTHELPTATLAMSVCACCGLRTIGTEPLCAHHALTSSDDDWASRNRLACDFIHRKVIPPRSVERMEIDLEEPFGALEAAREE